MKAEIDEMTIRTEGKYKEYFIQTIPDLKACCRAKKIKLY